MCFNLINTGGYKENQSRDRTEAFPSSPVALLKTVALRNRLTGSLQTVVYWIGILLLSSHDCLRLLCLIFNRTLQGLVRNRFVYLRRNSNVTVLEQKKKLKKQGRTRDT